MESPERGMSEVRGQQALRGRNASRGQLSLRRSGGRGSATFLKSSSNYEIGITQ